MGKAIVEKVEDVVVQLVVNRFFHELEDSEAMAITRALATCLSSFYRF